MKKNFKTHAQLSVGKWPALVAVGALALTPLVSAIAAQAAPPTVYRDKPGDTVTLSGVVTRDLTGNQFYFRSDDGRNFRVNLRGAQPAWLSNGDRVQVRGQRDRGDRDVIVAASVSPLNGNGNGGGVGENLTLSGVVTRDLSGNQFSFRADDGRTFRVALRGAQPAWLSNGDRVEVRGQRDRNERDVIVNADARLLNGHSTSGNSQYGVVTRMLSGNRFEMRAGDGRLITVTVRNATGLPRDLNVNDKVRVERVPNSTGTNAIVVFYVTIVEQHSDNSGGNGAVGQITTFSGTVVSVSSRTRFSVRGDGDRVYTVDTRSNLSKRISTGDRVRVVGRWSGALAVRADSVVLVSDNTGGSNAGNGAVNFWGRVESVSNNGLLRNLKVRSDNGWVYSVQYRNLQAFRVGDRVHVTGSISNGVVNATAIAKG